MKRVLYCIRTLLAMAFLLSGWLKVNDPIGMALKTEEYAAALGVGPLPLMAEIVAGAALGTLEFTLGASLVAGLHQRLTYVVVLLFMAVMTAVTIWLAVVNPVSDCGCFGDMLILSHGASLAKNLVLLAMSVALMRWGAGLGSAVGRGEAWMLSLPIMLACVAYAAWCVYTLPKADFRPYYVGADLGALRAGGGGGYDVKIVYRRGDETLLLEADDEDPDSTWTYVETRSTPRRDTAQGSYRWMPGITTWLSHRGDVADLWAIDENGEDRADDILSEPGYALLVTIPRMGTADESCAGPINLLYDLAQETGTPFHCLCAADSTARLHWTEYTGAEYGYLLADERTLWTMVRSNPGLILLEDGVVQRKWSSWNIDQAQAYMEQRIGTIHLTP